MPLITVSMYPGRSQEQKDNYAKAITKTAVDILKTKETVHFIGAKAFWLDRRLQHYLPRFQRERKKLGITFMHLFDYEVKKQKPEIIKIIGKDYKFLPKKYSSSTAIDIFGDYVVTFIGVKPGKLPEEPIQFVMKNKALAD